MSPGGLAIPLTCPDKVRKIMGDGNCLFRSFSSIVTGVQTEHLEIRAAILGHMKENEACMVSCGLVSDKGVQDYIRSRRMDKDGTYGTDVEIFAMAHLMHASMLVYKIDQNVWQRNSRPLWIQISMIM